MASNKQIVSINSTIASAEMLAEQHDAYVEQYVARANKALYEILGNIMALCVEIESSNLRDKIIKQMRDALRAKYQVKTQANSKLSSIVVKYVVRTGRKTAHVYGRVIQTAIDAGITPAQLPTYISEHGGIDAIRKKGANSAEIQSQKEIQKFNDASCEALSNQIAVKSALGTVQASNNSCIEQNPAADVKFTYLMCLPDSKTNGLKVVAALYPSAELERIALDDFLCACNAAAFDNDSNKFSDYCEDQGLNMDMVHRFMRSNSIGNFWQARELLLKVRNTMKIDGRLLPQVKHKQAA
jgi:hypothetical protein